jgi:hypothetical protein
MNPNSNRAEVRTGQPAMNGMMATSLTAFLFAQMNSRMIS